jgi:hypothetical protein
MVFLSEVDEGVGETTNTKRLRGEDQIVTQPNKQKKLSESGNSSSLYSNSSKSTIDSYRRVVDVKHDGIRMEASNVLQKRYATIQEEQGYSRNQIRMRKMGFKHEDVMRSNEEEIIRAVEERKRLCRKLTEYRQKHDWFQLMIFPDKTVFTQMQARYICLMDILEETIKQVTAIRNVEGKAYLCEKDITLLRELMLPSNIPVSSWVTKLYDYASISVGSEGSVEYIKKFDDVIGSVESKRKTKEEELESIRKANLRASYERSPHADRDALRRSQKEKRLLMELDAIREQEPFIKPSAPASPKLNVNSNVIREAMIQLSTLHNIKTPTPIKKAVEDILLVALLLWNQSVMNHHCTTGTSGLRFGFPDRMREYLLNQVEPAIYLFMNRKPGEKRIFMGVHALATKIWIYELYVGRIYPPAVDGPMHEKEKRQANKQRGREAVVYIGEEQRDHNGCMYGNEDVM